MDPKGLAQYADQTYKATAGLIKMVPAGKLDWRPAGDNNWLKLGQLLEHLADPTGAPMKMFITGEWPPMPPDAEMIPPAEKMLAAKSIEDVLQRLEADRQIMWQQLNNLSEADFKTRMISAPWAPTQLPLWVWLLQMVEHQVNHKMMLFAYLKMLGVKVGTGELYGM